MNRTSHLRQKPCDVADRYGGQSAELWQMQLLSNSTSSLEQASLTLVVESLYDFPLVDWRWFASIW